MKLALALCGAMDMVRPADFELTDRDGALHAVLSGEWTAVGAGGAEYRLAHALTGVRPVVIDLTGVARLDTAGAHAVLIAVGPQRSARYVARPAAERLLDLVRRAMQTTTPPVVPQRGLTALFERIGRAVVGLGADIVDTLAFIGELVATVGRAVADPKRVRFAPCIALSERAGLDAIPIVVATNFFVGAMVAMLGINVLKSFGAQTYVVDLVAAGVFREFGVLITAVVLAGRSGTAFAAEIGAMKMKQEIDAMRSLGIDPFDALVFPRFFALLFSFPLLTFAADVGGLAGGYMVAWTDLGIGPAFFFQRIVDVSPPQNFWIGLAKAPVLAMVISAIGCHRGMEVRGNIESLGRNVTTSVVQAVALTILIDCGFAFIFSQLNI